MSDLSWFENYGDDNYYGYDMTRLKMDEAYLTAVSEDGTPFSMYRKHKECEECVYAKMPFVENVPFIIKNVRQYVHRIYEGNNTAPTLPTNNLITNRLCDVEGYFEGFDEFGIYKLSVNRAGCFTQIIKKPVNVYFPILTVVLLYCAIFLGVFSLVYLWKKAFDKTSKKASKEEEKKPRVKSLDTFRGISIVIMIFVNYGSGGYEIFDHSVWNGLHLADLVFPWFMWIMGACIPISLASSFKRQTSNKDIFLNVLKRSVKLFCVGLFLQSSQYLECLRIFGVLQRFGICYFVVTTICLFFMERDTPEQKNNWKGNFLDIIKLYRGWIVTLLIFVVHTLILFLVVEPGCDRGYMGPGGHHKYMNHEKCTGGATGYIDRLVLGKHAYQTPTIKDVYHSMEFDPEGILGCLTSIVHVFFGVQAGTIILVYKTHSQRLIRWLSWSVVTGLLGGALCTFRKNEGLIPVNKNLWSISFVLVTCCFAFALLSLCYVLVDVKKWWSGKPFLFAGMNAIIMYIGHDMTYGHFPVRWTLYCGDSHPTHFVALFENIWGTGFWVLVSYYLYKINYFFTL